MTQDQLSRKVFFAKLKEKITDDRCVTCVEVAYNIAKEAHRGQVRDDGERYFEHVRAAAWIVLTETHITDQLRITILVCSALLHDLMEDTFVARRKHLAFIFDQFSTDITTVAWELTKQKKKDKRKTWRKLLNSHRAPTKLVKAADRLHNLRTLGACSRRKIRKQIRETRVTILPWLRETTLVEPACDNTEILSLADKITFEIERLEAFLESTKRRRKTK